jgi:hypothetical protein
MTDVGKPLMRQEARQGEGVEAGSVPDSGAVELAVCGVKGSIVAALDVVDALDSALPKNVPRHFRRIIKARHSGSGRARKIIATVEFIDGLQSDIEVRPIEWPGGIKSWSHQWTNIQGGAIYWDGKAWIRTTPHHQERANLAIPPAERPSSRLSGATTLTASTPENGDGT